MSQLTLLGAVNGMSSVDISLQLLENGAKSLG